jgi:2-polyprenyl-6-methoxyphenol hydroxylase-like FAD-dependent oxidoreductase
MSREQTTEVLVAGAGPVGMITAILLAENGIRVKVVDKESGTATHSYSCALHPASLQLLGEIGLAEEIVELGRRVDTVGLYDGKRRRAQIKLSGFAGDFPFVVVLPQSALEGILENQLARKHHIKIDWNHRLSTLHSEGERILATVDKLVVTAQGYIVPDLQWVVGKTLRIRAGFVIGADGHHSQVRQCLGIDYERLSEPIAFEVYEFETDAQLGSDVRVVLDDQTTNVLWPLPGDRCRWSFQSVPPRSVNEFPSKDRSVIVVDQPEADLKARRHVQELVRDRAPWFEGTIGEIDWRTEVQFEPGVSRQFGHGRCWLAGDAAHQTGPVGMQSMNVSLREAAELVGNVKKILREHGSSNLLTAYARERREEWHQLLGTKEELKPRTQTDPWISKRGARILPCLPGSGEHLRQLFDQIGLDLR